MQANDNPDLKIGYHQFRNLTQTYLKKMQAHSKPDDSECVTMARVWNTIAFDHLETKNAVFKDYSALFVSDYLELCRKQLEMTLSKGMSFYSAKYKLYLGGRPDAPSMYDVKNVPK